MINVPLATSTWGDEEIAAIHRVIDSDRYSMGTEVAQFEEQFAQYIGSKYCVMCNSGSSANLLMVAALCHRNIRPGDEVIVPAISWSTTYFPLNQYGLRLKFVDVDPKTLNFDLEELEAAITSKTRLIMAVNLLGNPNDFDAIAELVGNRDITLVEDNCESMGATYKGKFAGTFGVMGSFSTFFSHHISTMEGGLVVTDDEKYYHLLLSLRSHGWTRHLPEQNLIQGTKNPDPFHESFKFVTCGYNLRPLEFSGAIGQVQLKKLPAMLEQRRKNAKKFQELMAGHEYLDIQHETEGAESSWFGFALLCKPPLFRGDLRWHLQQLGIECRPIVTGNFVRQPVVLAMDDVKAGYMRNADYVDSAGLMIGNNPVELDYCRVAEVDPRVRIDPYLQTK